MIQLQPLANHLWQSTLFAAVAGLVTLALRKNRAQTRYWVWLAASVKFLIPFSLLVNIGSHWGRRAAPATMRPVFSYVLAQASQPFSVSTPPALPGPASSPSNWVPAVLSIIWALGCATLLCSWWRRWRGLRAALRSASPLDLHVGLKTMISPAFPEPGVCGILRPVLLLPAGITDRLTPAQLQAIVTHELCHVRRRDNLATAIHMSVEALFWFHPLVWWLGARLMEERERACDEDVLLMGSEPQVYAEGILKICELYLESPLPCVPGVTGANLRKRIEEIMSNRIGIGLSFTRKLALATAGAAAVAAPILVGVLNAPTIRAQSSAAAAPKFEVASIKPCKAQPGRMRGGGSNSSPGRLSTGCDLLVDDNNLGLIQRAYVRFAGGHTNPLGVLAIKGGPKWIHSDMYQIDAVATGSPGREMLQGPMLQKLLEDRFKLKIHRETAEGLVYALTANASPRLKPFQEGSCIQMPLTLPAPSSPPGQRFCKALISLLGPSVLAEGSTLSEFAKLLSLVLDRPVIDKTGMAGRFDIHLEFARDEFTTGLRGPLPDAPDGVASDPSKPTIFTAIQEQLGLKLAPARGPIEFLVVDHIERPSEN